MSSIFSEPLADTYRGLFRRGSSAASCRVAFIDCQCIHGRFSSFMTTLPFAWLSKQPCPRDPGDRARFESPAQTHVPLIRM